MKRITAIAIAIALLAAAAFASEASPGTSTHSTPAIAVAPYDGGKVALTLASGTDCAPWEHEAQLVHDVGVVDTGCWLSNRETVSLRWPHSGRKPREVAARGFYTREHPASAKQ